MRHLSMLNKCGGGESHDEDGRKTPLPVHFIAMAFISAPRE
jgi:hypothetical protein